MKLPIKKIINELIVCAEKSGFINVESGIDLEVFHDLKFDYVAKSHNENMKKLAIELKGTIELSEDYCELECPTYCLILNHTIASDTVLAVISR